MNSTTESRHHRTPAMCLTGYPGCRESISAPKVVYLIVDALAIAGMATAGKYGALSEIASQACGKVMLSLAAFGLFAYEALDGTAASIVLTAGSGSSLSGSSGSGSSGNAASDWTGTLLGMPFDRWLVGAVALDVAIGAIYQLKQAIKAGFTDEFRQAEMSQGELTWATRAGRLGHTARAFVYAMITWFLARAALNANAEQAGGLAKALDTLQEQPYGHWLLIAAGLGFVCYGLYCFVVARYRRANA